MKVRRFNILGRDSNEVRRKILYIQKEFKEFISSYEVHFKRAKELAVENPCLILLQENGTKEGWNGRAFWWPVLVAPENVPKTIYASKTIGEKLSKLNP